MRDGLLKNGLVFPEDGIPASSSRGAPCSGVRRVPTSSRARRVLVVGRSKQERGRVDRPARDDDDRRLDANRLTVPLDFDGFDLAPARVREQPPGVRVRPQVDVRPLDAPDARSRRRPRFSRGACTRTSCTCCRTRTRRECRAAREKDEVPARAAARRFPPCASRVGNRRVGERARSGSVGSDAELAVNVVEALGALVVRRERVVVDWPPRRHTVHVLERLESLRGAVGTARCPRTSCYRRRCSACTGGTRRRVRRSSAPRSDSEDASRRLRDSSSRLPAGRSRRARE